MLWFVISLGIIGSYASQCAIEKNVSGKGFHRELQVKFELKTTVFDNHEVNNCSLLLLQNVPSGLYIDLHEIKMKQDHGVAKVYSRMKIDVEKPEYKSPEHDVYISQELHIKEGVIVAAVKVPIHLRYHRPSQMEYSTLVTLNEHQTFISCQGSHAPWRLDSTTAALHDLTAPCHHSLEGRDLCKWMPLVCQYTKGEVITLEVSVGSVEETIVVITVSLIATLLGTGAIIVSIRGASVQTHTDHQDRGDSNTRYTRQTQKSVSLGQHPSQSEETIKCHSDSCLNTHNLSTELLDAHLYKGKLRSRNK